MSSDTSSSPTGTPSFLTPDTTGTTSSSSPDIAAVKKSRRQTAFYPNATNKQMPFSRSAAKRESVMALGSIEHLQHYFTKTGIAAKKTHLHKPHYGLVPAIGGPNNIRVNPSITSLADLNLPPSPVIPNQSRPAFPVFVKSYDTDPESLLPGVVDDLAEVSQVWKVESTTDDSKLLGGAANFDVLNVLKTTTKAIRSTRNYMLSLPDESTGSLRAQFRSKLLAPNSHVPTKLVTPPSADPLALIRKSALEVLTVLRLLEEGSRVPLSDDAYDAQSDHGQSSRVASPDEAGSDGLRTAVPQEDTEPPLTFSLVQVKGRDEHVPVWEDEVDVFDEEEEHEKRDHWDDRLVLGGGWLYRQDVRLDQLVKEQEVVKGYLDAVDEILFNGRKDGKRGWERERDRLDRGSGLRSKSRRASSQGPSDMVRERSTDRSKRRNVSAGIPEVLSPSFTSEPDQMGEISEEEEVNEDEMPVWARRNVFTDDPLGRVHAVLAAFLPADMAELLPPAASREEFLSALSSGQLLCIGYNACVRKSRKPWGYVNKDAIHDIFALERAEKEGGSATGRGKGWTFRRTDNLRLWAGALKLRYLLPLVVPTSAITAALEANNTGTQPLNLGNTPLPSPSPATKQNFPSMDTPLMFDARIVAKKADGWEDMLERVLEKWVEAIVDERRCER